MNSSTAIKSSYRVVAVDETRYFENLPEADKLAIDRIESVYMYDFNTVTYMCSYWSKHYFLMHLYTNVYVKAGVSEEERERLQDIYGNEPTQDDYFPIEMIDAEKNQVIVGELKEDQDETELREYLMGNHVL